MINELLSKAITTVKGEEFFLDKNIPVSYLIKIYLYKIFVLDKWSYQTSII